MKNEIREEIYMDAYMDGYLEGCAESDLEYLRADPACRLGYLVLAVSMACCVLFVLAATVAGFFA